MINSELKKRNLPPLKSREEMIEILQREEYGYLPDVEYKMEVSDPLVIDGRFASAGRSGFGNGTVSLSFVTLTITTEYGSHSFKVYRLLHKDCKKRPVVLLNNFHPANASFYFPVEELSEREVDYLVFVNKEMCTDDNDFSNGLASVLLPNGQDTDTTCGKLMIWAWGAMRVMDYALTLPGTDPENVAILGHSRLGKTALVTAMMDERFKYAFSNNSGCSGAALSRGGTGAINPDAPIDSGRGENICDITDRFSYWFCKNYLKYRENMYPDDFDQHYLISTIAPRFVVVASNSGDNWADQKSEQLGCHAASEMWENKGLLGLVDCNEFAKPGEAFLKGRLGYFMVDFVHFLSRHNWHRYLEFIELHKGENI